MYILFLPHISIIDGFGIWFSSMAIVEGGGVMTTVREKKYQCTCNTYYHDTTLRFRNGSLQWNYPKMSAHVGTTNEPHTRARVGHQRIHAYLYNIYSSQIVLQILHLIDLH